jgi:hypothetical protein
LTTDNVATIAGQGRITERWISIKDKQRMWTYLFSELIGGLIIEGVHAHDYLRWFPVVMSQTTDFESSQLFFAEALQLLFICRVKSLESTIPYKTV